MNNCIPRTPQQVNLATKFIILFAVLAVGCLVTVGCIILASYMIDTGISYSGILTAVIIGIVDFFILCPTHYYFRFGKIIHNPTKHSIKFPYRFLLYVPYKVTKRQCLKWIFQTLTYSIMGVLSGLLCLIISRVIDDSLPKEQYVSIFLNGTLILYLTGFVSLYFNPHKENINKKEVGINKNSTFYKAANVLALSPYYIVAMILILSAIISLGYLFIHIDNISIWGCMLICFSLLLRILIASLFLQILSLNKNLKTKIQFASSNLQYMSAKADKLLTEKGMLNHQNELLNKDNEQLRMEIQEFSNILNAMIVKNDNLLEDKAMLEDKNALLNNEYYRLRMENDDQLCILNNITTEAEKLTKENEMLKKQKRVLFKEKREMINLLCREYTDHWDSPKLRPLILNKINQEITKLQTNAFKKTLEKEIIEYYGDLFEEIRDKNLLKPDDIYFLLLIIAGYSQKSISIILSLHPKTYYTKKYRLIEKFDNFEIQNKMEILSILSPIQPDKYSRINSKIE